MALFKNSYSGLITKGLGMPACCGMLTMGFGLFVCKIEVIVPPEGGSGGGGGSFAVHPGIYVPWPKKVSAKTKQVQITVKFKERPAWRRAYVIDSAKADIVVKVINIVNAVSSRVTVGVNQMRHAVKRVTAVFTRRDK
jgi:hypothetical protein